MKIFPHLLGFQIFILVISGCIPSYLYQTSTKTPLPVGDSFGDLELFVTLGKKEFRIGEEIRPIATIHNKGMNNVLVRKKFSPGFDPNEEYVNLDVFFFDPSGEVVRDAGITVDYGPSPYYDMEFQVIHPDAILFDEICMLNFYYIVNKPGKYSYQIQYRNHLDPSDGRKAWKGTLISNKIEFEVVP